MQLPALVVEAQVLLELRLPLLLLFQRRPVRRLLLLRVVEAADKPVLVEVVRAVAEVAVVQEAVALRLWLVTRFAPVRRFPAWRSSMPCLHRAPIRMLHSAHVVRKPAPAVDSAIRCSVPEPRRCIARRCPLALPRP